MLTPPLRARASLRRSTTSLPSTPAHLKPFVQLVSFPMARPSCLQGKENVKPSGRQLPLRPFSWTKSARHLAMWSNSCTPGPSMISFEIANTFESIWNCFSFSILMRRTLGEEKYEIFVCFNPNFQNLKLVPPRSRAKNLPVSSPVGR